MFAAREVISGIGACTANIANGLIENRGNAHLGDVSVAKESGDFAGVALIGLDLFIGFSLGFRRLHEDAIESQVDQAAGEDKTGRPGFITNLEIAELDIEFFGELA